LIQTNQNPTKSNLKSKLWTWL